MFSIKETSYGLRIVLGDTIQESEMAKWAEFVTASLRNQKRPFGVLIDLRTLKPLTPAAAEQLQQTAKNFLRAGLERTTMVYDSALLKLQFKRLSAEAGLASLARFVDAGLPDWEDRAQAWVVNGKEPGIK